MNQEDEEFLARIQKEQDEHGLELKESVDRGGFDKIMKRLIEEPPAPKRKRGKRGITRSRGKQR